MRKRNTHINLRTTQQEKQRYQRNAKICGLPLSEYLRKLANGYEPKPATINEYSDLIGFLTDLYNEYRDYGSEVNSEKLAQLILSLQESMCPVKSNGDN